MPPPEGGSANPKCSLCGFRHPKFGADLHHRCGVCDRVFPSKIGLEFHQRVHKNV